MAASRKVVGVRAEDILTASIIAVKIGTTDSTAEDIPIAGLIIIQDTMTGGTITGGAIPGATQIGCSDFLSAAFIDQGAGAEMRVSLLMSGVKLWYRAKSRGDLEFPGNHP